VRAFPLFGRRNPKWLCTRIIAGSLNSLFDLSRRLRSHPTLPHAMRKFFKRKDSPKQKGNAKAEAPLGPSPSGDTIIATLGGLSLSDSHDREETKQRFVKASQALEDALRVWKSWKYTESGVTEFPELAGEPERFDGEFRNKLEKIMDTRKAALDDKSIWTKSGDTIVAIFTAFSPFARNFLTVAIQAQSVCRRRKRV
jgi:hypothetical protein